MEKRIAFLPITSDGKRVYAGFWKRFCAAWIDGLVIMPLAYFLLWLEGFDKNLAILVAIPSMALFSMYNIFFNARFGGTVGKLAVGIRITKPDGTLIGWLEAWKRSAVDLAFALILLAAEVWALTQVTETAYSELPFPKRIALFQSSCPAMFSAVNTLHNAWILSELLVLLLNERKRALHDFIAGTVVIHKKFVAPQQPGRD